MQKFILLFLCVTLKVVVGLTNIPTIMEYENRALEDGGYLFKYTLSDGSSREETGSLDLNGNLVVSGVYSYLDPSGNEHTVEYYADSNGYHPQIVESGPPPSIASLPPRLVASLLGG